MANQEAPISYISLLFEARAQHYDHIISEEHQRDVEEEYTAEQSFFLNAMEESATELIVIHSPLVSDYSQSRLAASFLSNRAEEIASAAKPQLDADRIDDFVAIYDYAYSMHGIANAVVAANLAFDPDLPIIVSEGVEMYGKLFGMQAEEIENSRLVSLARVGVLRNLLDSDSTGFKLVD